MTNSIEQWRDVVGYEGLYQVSDLGRVKSLLRYVKTRGEGAKRSAPSKLIAQHHDGYDYPCVKIWTNGRKKTYRVHILVARTFLGTAPNGMEIRHLGGGRNPALSNLAYGTHKQNMDDMLIHGVRQFGEDANSAKLSASDVIRIVSLYASGMTCEDVAKHFNTCAANISAIMRGEHWNSVTGISRARKKKGRLTANTVRAIYAMRGTIMQKDIAKLFGVGKVTVSCILRGKQWAAVTGHPAAGVIK